MMNDKFTELYKQELALQLQKQCEQQMYQATLPILHNNRLTGPVVTQKTMSYENGFWSVIQITADDHVRFKLFRGGWFSKALYLLGKEPRLPDGDKQQWDSIGYQGSEAKLEVTLGNTYLKIDEIMAEEVEDSEHRDFIKEMAKTDPENLKMIAGLKNLDDGMKDGSPAVAVLPDLNGTSVSKLSGSTTYPNISTGSITFGPPASESVRVDEDGNVYNSENPNSVGLDSKFNSELVKAIRDIRDGSTP